MTLRKLYSKALEKRIQSVVPNFSYKKDDQGAMEPEGIDAHHSFELLFLLPEWFKNCNVGQQMLDCFPTQELKISIITYLEHLRDFVRFLDIGELEERLLHKYELWENYVNFMDLLSKQVFRDFVQFSDLGVGYSYYFHIFTYHCKFLLTRDGTLGKYSNQSLEYLHAKHKKMYASSIQKGKYSSNQEKILCKCMRMQYLLPCYKDCRVRKDKEWSNNKQTRNNWGNFSELLASLGFPSDTESSFLAKFDMEKEFHKNRYNIT